LIIRNDTNCFLDAAFDLVTCSTHRMISFCLLTIKAAAPCASVLCCPVPTRKRESQLAALCGSNLAALAFSFFQAWLAPAW
jgi:hypothetical protein